MVVWIFIFSLAVGQILKIPFGGQSGLTVLDITVFSFDILALFNLKFKLKSPPLWIKTALIFILVALFSLIFTPLKLSLSEYFISVFYTLRFSTFILLGWIIYSGVFSNLRTNITQILLYSGVILAGLGILQLIFLPNLQLLASFGWDPHYFRTVSTLLDPNFFGGFSVLTLLLLVTKGQKIFKTKILIILFILTYLAFITTFSRSSAVMFFISFTILSILNKSTRLFLLTIILTAGFVINFIAYQQSVAVPRNINRTASAQFRLSTWQQGWQLFSSHPLLGVGFNAYRYGLREYQLGNEQFLQSRGSSTNDSSLLYVASTSGIIGLISYLAIFVSLIITSYKTHLAKNQWEIILLSALGGLLAHSFFANSLFYPWILLWVVLVATKQGNL